MAQLKAGEIEQRLVYKVTRLLRAIEDVLRRDTDLRDRRSVTLRKSLLRDLITIGDFKHASLLDLLHTLSLES